MRVDTIVSAQMHPLAKTLACNRSFYRGRTPEFFVFRSKFETGGGNKTGFLLDFLFLSHNGGEKGRYGQNEARSQRLLRRNAELSKLDLATSVKPKIIVSFISPPTPQ